MRSSHTLVIALVGGLGTAACQVGQVTDQKPTSPSGRAIYLSDVETVPDSPITTGFVIVVPPSRVDAFWQGLATPPPGDRPGHTEITVSAEHLAAAGAQATPITGGSFPLTGVTEHGLLCLANPDQAEVPVPPYHVVGCGSVPASTGRLTLSFGLGGVAISG